jgi:SAM-dependent methyltransferase
VRSITAYWDDAASGFDAEPDHGLGDPVVRVAWALRLRGWLPSPPCDVLDVGCGTGSLSRLMLEDGHRVVGTDLSPNMVEAARLKCAGLDASFSVGDATEPPVSARSQDAVVVRHLLWTLPDPHLALARWTRTLRDGGRLVLVEGRWAQPSTAGPYAADSERMLWRGGVSSRDLTAALEPLAASLVVHDLATSDELWGRSVSDERYAVVALF